MSQLPFISSATRLLHINIWNVSARSHHRERARDERKWNVCAIFFLRYVCTCIYIYIYVHILSCLCMCICKCLCMWTWYVLYYIYKPKNCASRVMSVCSCLSAHVQTVHVYFCLRENIWTSFREIWARIRKKILKKILKSTGRISPTKSE